MRRIIGFLLALCSYYSLVAPVRMSLQPVVLKISKHMNLIDGGIRANQILKAKCIVQLIVPAVNITWTIDGKPVEKRFLKSVVNTNELRNGHLITMSSQEINLYLTEVENGKKLICHASHPALTTPQRCVLPLNVKFAPQEHPRIFIEKLPRSGSFVVNITINANPQPVTRWTVNGRLIKEGESVDMYRAYVPQATLKAGEYIVLLKNIDCKAERATLFVLEATNILGTQKYVVQAEWTNNDVANIEDERMEDGRY
ncbi:hypothetical protein ZHAS_00005072 [Anopheles sinensis]|uniref:Ig-like domain-containing protein n=1 Tax=Anopheles sinensis TaxID=74873 RepID=A0A084VIG3_ANOSI|nr:hypothetical protein ZHAS_00005072 [Anopheles sinensis]